MNHSTQNQRSWRNRFTTSIFVAAISAFTGNAALAAGTTFELENPAAANIKDATGNSAVDWASLYDVPGPELANPSTATDGIIPTPKSTLPAGVFAAGFYRDFAVGQTSDTSAYTTGTKDTQNISGGGSTSGEWQCKKVNNISDKGDVLNAYATLYEHTNGDLMLAMGVERASDNGTSKVGFWFLQDDEVGCSSSSGKAETFSGNHRDGDILVIVDFEQGGNNPTSKVLEWQGDAATGTLVEIGTGTACSTGIDLTCATTNQTAALLHSNLDPPWYTQTKTSGSGFSNNLQPLMFFEAQVNLTDLGIIRCFNKFVPNTRQSASVNATVFDYLVGDFEVCGFDAAKACTSGQISASGTQINFAFNVSATNTGIAPLDLSVSELTNGCSLTGATTANVVPGATANFPVSCPNQGVEITNVARVSATAFGGTAVGTKTVSAKSGDFAACIISPDSDINLTSDCEGVRLEDTGNRLGLEATINGLVKGPAVGAGVEALAGVGLNVYDASCTGDIGACTPVETISIGNLAPGAADTSWSHTYDVALEDNTVNSQCAADAIFRRNVIAFGTGVLSGLTYYSSLLSGIPVAVPVDCEPCIDCEQPETP